VPPNRPRLARSPCDLAQGPARYGGGTRLVNIVAQRPLITSMGSPSFVSGDIPPLRPADLPRPPGSVLAVLRACADESAELPAIAALVAADPALAADLLQVVNSAYFGLADDIASVERAVTVLGLDALRNRVLCLTVRTVAGALDLPHFDCDSFVEDALRRACAARLLATGGGVDADDAFTAGLLQDLGLLVLAFLNPLVTRAQWDGLLAAPPDARRTLEQALCGDTHDGVLGALASLWSLPATLADAITDHHARSPGTALARVLAAADWIAAVYARDGDPVALTSAHARTAELLEVDQPAVAEIINAIPTEVAAAAAGLGMRVPVQAELAALGECLNSRLAAENAAFQEMNWQLERTLAERDALAARLSRELEVAREIQCSLLPQRFRADLPIWARNVAAHELSGDFYDYFDGADGRVLFNVGDVAGKGLTAALLMAKTCSLFRCLGRRLDTLAEVMAVINDELAETAVRGMFVTMIAGAWDAQSREVEIVCAGHPPPLLWRDGEGIALVEGGDTPPLGIVPGIAFTAHKLSLEQASLYLYSDGISEARDADGAELGLRGLARLIARASRLPPASRIDSIVDAIAGTPAARRDDITLAVLDPSALH